MFLSACSNPPSSPQRAHAHTHTQSHAHTHFEKQALRWESRRRRRRWWNHCLLSFVWGTCCFCIQCVITKDSFDSLALGGLSLLLLFGLGLNLIHLTILSPPLMNSSVAVWTRWTAGAHINTLWVCLLKAACQIVLWTGGTEFRGMRLGGEIWICSPPLLFIGSWQSGPLLPRCVC